MGNYILVPLKTNDRVEEILPRIEEVAQAGTVIFLTPYRANGFFKKCLIRAGLSTKGIPTDKNALMQYSYEKQTRLADERVSLAREALYRRGVKVIAYVYMNRLGRLLSATAAIEVFIGYAAARKCHSDYGGSPWNRRGIKW